MNQEPIKVLVALCMLSAPGAVSHLFAAETAVEDVPAVTTEQTAGSDKGAAAVAGTLGAAETQSPAAEEPASEAKPVAEADESGSAVAGSEGASQTEPASDKEPVTGAFGILLGKRFDPCMVAAVLGEEEKTYRDPDKAEHKGTLYRVEPRVPNEHFNSYSVETTEDGIIYAIRGMHEPTAKASRCEVPKKLAAILTEKYGKPRGKGFLGDWYAFRDMSSELYRGVRLYAPKCRVGRYSISYSDDNAKVAPPPEAAQPSDTSGL